MTTFLCFATLFVLLFLGVPIGIGMALVGFVGFGLIVGFTPSLFMVAQVTFDTVLTYDLSVLPLFLIMGNLIAQSGLAKDLYDAAFAFVGHLRGGLAAATIVACGGFSAVCGSSLATAATMSRVAMPPMRRYGYADSLAAGSIAAGGTLGILIPPSVVLVLYGIITETNIGVLFMAGVLPGILGILLYVAAIFVATALRPELGPGAERTAWRERLRALVRVWGVALLFLLIMGGIYLGVFTPTEAAGVGATGALVFALLRRTMGFRDFVKAIAEAGRTSAMMFVVLIGALIFANLMNVARFPNELVDFVQSMHLSAYLALALILLIYIVLGAILESISMMLLTVPIFFPLVKDLGFDPVWFGIVVVVVIELSLITPPIGMNVFMLNATLPDVPVRRIFAGVTPFILADVVRLAILVAVPAVALALPAWMK